MDAGLIVGLSWKRKRGSITSIPGRCIFLGLLTVVVLALAAVSVRQAVASNMNGRGGAMLAYYDGKLFTINFKELSPQAEAAIDAHNQIANIIYQADSVPGFISVIDAIQGDGFNALWEEVQITFNTGFPAHQFLSDNDILAAAASGEITLTDTDEIYRCSVLGPKKK